MMQPLQFYIIMVAGLFNLSTTSRIDEGHDLLIKGMDVLVIKLPYPKPHECPMNLTIIVRGRDGIGGSPFSLRIPFSKFNVSSKVSGHGE